MRPGIVGRHLTRPRLLGPEAVAFELASRGSERLVLDAARGTAGLYLLTKPEWRALEELRTSEATGSARHALLLFRKHADGNRVSALRRVPGERQLVIECGALVFSLRIWGAPAVTLVKDGRAVASLGSGREAWPIAEARPETAADRGPGSPVPGLFATKPLAELEDKDLSGVGAPRITAAPGLHQIPFPSWREAFACLLELCARGEAFAARRRERLAAARRELKRLTALLGHLRADLLSLADPSSLRRQAEALLAAPHLVPPGVALGSVPDPYSPGEVMAVTLDPGMDAIANAERLFVKARRSARGREQIEKRLAETRDALAVAQSLAERLASASALEELEAPASALPPRPAAAATGRGPRHYLTTGGLSIHAGRGAKENHRLTFAFARPEDVWLHARDVPGAHVILRDSEGRAGRQDLLEAAEVAAFFSDAAGAAAVDVHVARRKHVRPAGGGPGRVKVAYSDTLRVSPKDPEGRLRRR